MRVLLAIVLILFSFSTCYSAPSITNAPSTISNGGSITITGTGFGADASPAPLLWKNFEDRTVGTNVIGNDGWTTDGGATITYNGTTQRNANSSVNVKDYQWYNTATDKSVGEFERQVYPAVKGKKLLSYWWYADKLTNPLASPDGEAQIKTARILSGHVHTEYPVWYYEIWYRNDGSVKQKLAGILPGTGTDWGINTQLKKWARMTVLIDESTQNVADGQWHYQYLQDGVNKSGSKTSILTSNDQYPNPMQWISFGYSLVNAENMSFNTYWDDIYANDGWHRVELCNSSSYATATLCEIQPQTNRSDTSITVTVNAGSFGPGSSAYLIAIDNNNVASTGRAVTLSGTAPVVNGLCGDESAVVNVCPSENLCTQGTPSTVTQNASTCTWSCVGSGGGTTDSCSAPFSTAGGDPAEFSFSATEYSVPEGDYAALRVNRTVNTVGLGSITYRTDGVNASGTLDYWGTDGETLTFADGETFKNILIETWPDDEEEGTETTIVTLIGSSGTLVSPTSATLSILDGEPPVIDDGELYTPIRVMTTGTPWRVMTTGTPMRVVQ